MGTLPLTVPRWLIGERLPRSAAQLNLAFEPAGFVTKFLGGIFDLRSAAPVVN